MNETWADYFYTRLDSRALEYRAISELGCPDVDYDLVAANIAKLQAAKLEWEAVR